MISTVVISFGIALAFILPIWTYPMLKRLGVMDVPNARSSHEVPTVRGMGVALAIAACLTTAVLAGVNGDENFLLLTLLGAVAAALGFVEDLRGIPVAKRAGLQLLVGGLFGCLVAWTTGAGWIWILIIAVAVAAYVNVANFMDGIDGISGLHGGVAGVSYAVIGALSNMPWMTHLGLVTAGVFLSFLPWNLSGRRVFLGDVGSYFLGAWIAGIAILAVASGLNPLLAVGPTVIYLADTGSTLLRRLYRGERWFEAHRSHVYQRLTLRGGTHLGVALLVSGFSVLTVYASFFSLDGTATGATGAVLLMLFVAIFYLCMPRLINKIRPAVARDSR